MENSTFDPLGKWRDPLEKFQRYLDRAAEPQTEEDHAHALDFWIHHALFFATREYRTGWAGIIEVGTEVDMNRVESSLDLEILDPVIKLVPIICEQFNVAMPNEGDESGKRNFQEWFEEMQKRNGKEDFVYPDFVFRRIYSQ